MYELYAKEGMTVSSQTCLFPGGCPDNGNVTVILDLGRYFKPRHSTFTDRRTAFCWLFEKYKNKETQIPEYKVEMRYSSLITWVLGFRSFLAMRHLI
jgi:hypothetical protein